MATIPLLALLPHLDPARLKQRCASMPWMLFTRVCLCCLVAWSFVHAHSAEDAAVETGIQKFLPIMVFWSAPGGTVLNMRPGEENLLKADESGPATIGYEKALISCDTFRFWQSAVAGVKRLVPERIIVSSGPFSSDPQRVSIDSRESQLPKMGFRGLMRPSGVTVQRLPLDTNTPGAVRFQADLANAGDFFGSLHTKNGWTPYAGWADKITLIIRGDIDPQVQDLINLRIETVHLYGRPRQAEQPYITALFMRMKKPLDEKASVKAVNRDADTEAGTESMLITLFFDPQGTMENGSYSFGAHTQGWGDHLIDDKAPQGSSAPVIVPSP